LISTAVSVGRLHIVAIAALASLTFGWAFTGRYVWLVPAVCALDWFLVNLLNRVVDLKEDASNQIVGTSFVARWRRAILVFGFTLLAGSLVAVHALAPVLTPFRLAYHALGLSYNWRLLPGKRRLKELYLLKNTASATGFLLTCFAYPIAVAGGVASLSEDVGWIGVLAFGVFFFLFELSYEILYDLRDVVGDREANVRTFAVVHGETVAQRIADVLMGSSALILVAAYLAGVVPWRLACMAAAPITQLIVTRFIFKRGISAKDCIRLTWLGALLLTLYHVWIALGLAGT
jgi:4-hydroxybenzoate polyprenyltransferase